MPIVIIRVLLIDTAALSRVVDGKEVKGKEANSNSKSIQTAGSAIGAAFFSFPFRNGKQSKAQRAAAMPLPFGLPFRPRPQARRRTRRRPRSGRRF